MDPPLSSKATALYYAVSFGLCRPAEYLISTDGEDVNAKCGYHGSPLHAASSNGHLDALTLLLDSGANVNMATEDKRTPLCAAYDGRHLEVMRLLLEHGAVVDVPYDSIGPLVHVESCYGQADILLLLLQHSADTNGAAEPYCYMPLHWAAYGGCVDVVQFLLERGAEINPVSLEGTPLYSASISRAERLEIVWLLLKHGADVHIWATGRKAPFEVATDKGHMQIAQLLLEYGADKE
jgi:ankyrin repeat protein